MSEEAVQQGVRRSNRILAKIPVVIKGKDAHGQEFEEETDTRIISKYGARIHSRHKLEEGSILKLRLKRAVRWADIRVAWVEKPKDETMGDAGIEFDGAASFFGVSFPDKD